jgi:FAD/FMN-containing dehydrogenase
VILLRTDRLRGVEIDPERRIARVLAGSRWEEVVPAASELGLAALHGSTPDVSVTGYTLGGGVGWYARKLGLAANSVTAIELVTADGRLRRADREHNPELFWALRGGGGNFGVITALEFQLYDIPEVYAGAIKFRARGLPPSGGSGIASPSLLLPCYADGAYILALWFGR